MRFSRLVVPVAIFVVFTVGAFAVLQVAEAGQRGAPATTQTEVNESLVVEYDAYQFVDAATAEWTAGFTENVTVYSNGTELQEGDDYRWNSTDGTILYLDTNATVEGNSSTITYEYEQNTDRVQEVGAVIQPIVRAVGRGGLLAAGFGFVGFLVVFAGIIGRRFTGGTTSRGRFK